jgi:hypothetical protein
MCTRQERGERRSIRPEPISIDIITSSNKTDHRNCLIKTTITATHNEPAINRRHKTLPRNRTFLPLMNPKTTMQKDTIQSNDTSRPKVLFGAKEFLRHHWETANASVDHSNGETAGTYYVNHWTTFKKPHNDSVEEDAGDSPPVIGDYYTHHWTAMNSARKKE